MVVKANNLVGGGFSQIPTVNKISPNMSMVQNLPQLHGIEEVAR